MIKAGFSFAIIVMLLVALITGLSATAAYADFAGVKITAAAASAWMFILYCSQPDS